MGLVLFHWVCFFVDPFAFLFVEVEGVFLSQLDFDGLIWRLLRFLLRGSAPEPSSSSAEPAGFLALEAWRLIFLGYATR